MRKIIAMYPSVKFFGTDFRGMVNEWKIKFENEFLIFISTLFLHKKNMRWPMANF